MIVRDKRHIKGDGARNPQYSCMQKTGMHDKTLNHCNSIMLSILDTAAKEKIIEIVSDPIKVREQVMLRRVVQKPVIDVEDVEATITNIQVEIDNLFELA